MRNNQPKTKALRATRGMILPEDQRKSKATEIYVVSDPTSLSIGLPLSRLIMLQTIIRLTKTVETYTVVSPLFFLLIIFLRQSHRSLPCFPIMSCMIFQESISEQHICICILLVIIGLIYSCLSNCMFQQVACMLFFFNS